MPASARAARTRESTRGGSGPRASETASAHHGADLLSAGAPAGLWEGQAGPPLTPLGTLALQRAIGNHAVARLLSSRELSATRASPLQRALASHAAPALVQRFTEEDVGGDPTRISDDQTAAVTQASHVGGQELFATADLISEGQDKLRAVKSGIELNATSAKMTLPQPDGSVQTLQGVWPKNTQNQTGGVNKPSASSSGVETINPMQLWADCGKSNGVVIGGSSRHAVIESQSDSTEHRTRVGSPSSMKAQVLLKVLQEVAALQEAALKGMAKKDPGRKAFQKYIKELRQAIKKVEKGLANLQKKEAKAKKDKDWAAIRKTYDELAGIVVDLYARHSEDWQDTVSRNAKINEYAEPDIGQGYTISSGGEKFKGVSTWNFHWAGVILKSRDRADSVTLENYAVGDPSVENDEWVYQMYGHLKKEQTFHQQHLGFQQHGKTPTTMVVEAVPKKSS